MADTLARRPLGVLAASCCTPRTAGAAARLSLIAAPIGLGDAPLAARVSLWAGLLGAIVSAPWPTAVLAVVPDIGQAASTTRRAAPSSAPRRAESVIQRAARGRQGRLMPPSGDRIERDLWVMS